MQNKTYFQRELSTFLKIDWWITCSPNNILRNRFQPHLQANFDTDKISEIDSEQVINL